MKALVLTTLAGVLVMAPASVMTVAQAQAEEEALNQYELKIEGMT